MCYPPFRRLLSFAWLFWEEIITLPVIAKRNVQPLKPGKQVIDLTID